MLIAAYCWTVLFSLLVYYLFTVHVLHLCVMTLQGHPFDTGFTAGT